MIVAHNLNALGTLRNLNTSNASLSGSLQSLSSGYRINTGADDPSGLIISEQLRAQTAGLKRAVSNTQEAQNVLGIAEGALNEVSNILKKMKQLAVHSANNGVTSPEQIAADQAEVDSSVQTIDRIARTTKYSDQYLLNGNKALSFDSRTEVNSTADFPLLDTGLSEIRQISSYAQRISLSFNGTDEHGDASMVNQASRAYLEIDGADSRLELLTDASGVTVLSKEQSFTLNGVKGSRNFNFAAGTSLGEIADAINSAGDSISAEASLIFSSAQSVDMIAYTTTSTITDLGVQTDGGGGTIPIFNSTTGVQGMPANIVINAADQVNNFDVIATNVGANQVQFDMIDNLGNIRATQTHTLGVVGGGGNGTQLVTLNSINGTGLTFTYNYGNDGGAANYDRPTGNLLDFSNTGAITNNGLTTAGLYAPVTNAATGLPAGAAVDTDDLIGNNWFVNSTVIDADTVRFTLRDNTNTVTVIQNVDMAALADIGTGTAAVNLTTGGGTNVSFNWGYENDPALNAYDHIGAQTLATFNRNGVRTMLNGMITNGPNALNVTSPSGPVSAVQNMTALIDIFDVVNGETPLTISAAAGAGAGEVVFTIQGNTTNPLTTQTVNLAAFAYASTGSQAISLTTPNGSLIEFDYFYENDPTTNRYDRPVGDLMTIDAVAVDSERLFNGVSQSASAAGASVDINLDPATGRHLQNLEYGRNTDGQGRIFIKIVEHDTATSQIKFELYKNADYSPSALIGWGSGTADGVTAISISQTNDSNLAGEITFDDAGGTISFMDERNFGDHAYVAIGGIWGNNGVAYNSGFKSALNSQAGSYNLEETVFSGVELGSNTDGLGKIYFKTVQDAANSGQVMAYRDSRMRDEDLVAMSEAGLDLSADSELILNAVNGSGLGIITRTGAVDWDGGAGTQHTGEIQFEQLGLRVSAQEYGSRQTLAITQSQGQCWLQYDSEGNSKVITAAQGTVRLSGSDAVVNINGQKRFCDGLELELATLDLSGRLVFKAGEVGATTVAQVGYSVGSVFTNAAFLTDTGDGWTDTNGDGNRDTDEITTFKAGANLVNAGNNTTMVLDGFRGGMQLQLGEGSGGQERTVLGISAATALDLGKVRTKDGMLTLNDLLSGGAGALAQNPVLSMRIIDQAITDVADLRARIGAWQSNLLQTNANSLEVAIENITKTESYIRDADMAGQSTDFAKNQIMVQAGTSMLAQANQLQQNVLALLN